jgi:hypothetical protein
MSAEDETAPPIDAAELRRRAAAFREERDRNRPAAMTPDRGLRLLTIRDDRGNEIRLTMQGEGNSDRIRLSIRRWWRTDVGDFTAASGVVFYLPELPALAEGIAKALEEGARHLRSPSPERYR